MPYNYYQIVRVFCFIGFIAVAYLDVKNKFYYFIILWIALAGLFNPFLEFRFSSEVWQEIDRSVAVFLIIFSLFNIFKQPENVEET